MPTTSTRMPSHERRAAILQAAVRLFAERGFRGVTTRELAAAVGVSEPVLYQHFATKRDLYNAILESKIQDTVDRGWNLDSLMKRSDDRGVFTCVGEIIIDWYFRDPSYVRLLLFSGLEGHELAELFHQHATIRSHRAAIAGYIRRRIEEGAFRDTDPVLAARSFGGAVSSYALARVVFGCHENETPEQAVRVMVDLFLNGITGRQRRPAGKSRNGQPAAAVSKLSESPRK